METDSQEQWIRKSRFFIQMLIFSIALNIGLLSSLIYFILQEKNQAISFDLQPADSKKFKKNLSHFTIGEVLSFFFTLSYQDLISLLANQELVEEGYKKRDLALATLVTFHYVDLEKALQGFIPQKRTIFFQHNEGPEQLGIQLYPGLTEDQFKEIIHFIQTERYPFTTQGLFLELKQKQEPKDSSLLNAFYLTPEYIMMMTLFFRAGLPLPPDWVVQLIIQGEWSTFNQFVKEQKQVQDLSSDRLKDFLFLYTKNRSTLAAKVLLAWDASYILKKCEDADLMMILDLFDEISPPLETFLKQIILSPRSDVVWKKAAQKLFAHAHLPLPHPYDHQITLQTFIPSSVSATTNLDRRNISLEPSPIKQQRKHRVERGECLWKISRKYKVSIEKIREINHLKNDNLPIGKELIIP